MVQNSNNLEFEIILVLIKNKAHLREIARTLNESHSTILRKINTLIEEKAVDYRKEGRNNVYFIKNNLMARNYVYSAEIYKLNKILKKHPEFLVIFEDIKKIVSKGTIILFGSYARGNPKKESDIDIYVETTNAKIKQQIQGINSRISVKIGKFDMNSLLIKEIIKNHVIVRGVEEFYERDTFFEET